MEITILPDKLSLRIPVNYASQQPVIPNGARPVVWRCSFVLDAMAGQKVRVVPWGPAPLVVPPKPDRTDTTYAYYFFSGLSDKLLFKELEPTFMASAPEALPTRAYDQTFVGSVMVVLDDKATPNPLTSKAIFDALSQRLAEVLRICWLNILPPSLCELLMGPSSTGPSSTGPSSTGQSSTGRSEPPPWPASVTPYTPGSSLQAWLENTVVALVTSSLTGQFKWGNGAAYLLFVGCQLVPVAQVLATPTVALSKVLPSCAGDRVRVFTLLGEVSSPWKAGWKGVGGGFRSAPSASVRFVSYLGPRNEVDVVGRTDGGYLTALQYFNETWSDARPEKGWGPVRDAPLAIRDRNMGAGVFARGADDCLRYWRFQAGRWMGGQGVVRLEGVLSSPVVGVDLGVENQYCLAARGGNGVVQVLSGDVTRRPTWTPLGGDGSGTLALVSWEPGRFDLFGRSKKGTLLHWWYTNGKWSALEDWGGAITSDPVAVSWGKGRLDIFALDAKGNLVHYWYDGAPGFWTHPKGDLVGTLAATSSKSGRLEVVGRKSNGQLFLAAFPESSTKAAWAYGELGGATRLDPAIISPVPNRIDIFAVDDSGTLMQWPRVG